MDYSREVLPERIAQRNEEQSEERRESHGARFWNNPADDSDSLIARSHKAKNPIRNVLDRNNIIYEVSVLN